MYTVYILGYAPLPTNYRPSSWRTGSNPFPNRGPSTCWSPLLSKYRDFPIDFSKLVIFYMFFPEISTQKAPWMLKFSSNFI